MPAAERLARAAGVLKVARGLVMRQVAAGVGKGLRAGRTRGARLPLGAAAHPAARAGGWA